MPIWIITGANRGLGLEFVTQLIADSTNTVIATTRSPPRDPEPLYSIYAKNLQVTDLDTSSEDSITDFGSLVSMLFGATTKIDFLLNNAGINANSSLTSLNFTSTAFTNHMNINVFGPAKIVQVLQPHLQSGSVVMNMTSGLASMAYNSAKENPECTVYAMSKAALNMLTVHQAKHLGTKGVKVICMDPGWVKTDMGGKDAVLEKEVSIGGMLKVLRELKDGDEGKFFVYDGSVQKW